MESVRLDVCDSGVNTDRSDKQQTQEVMSMESGPFYVCLRWKGRVICVYVSCIHAHPDSFTAARNKHYRPLTLTESPAYLDRIKTHMHTGSKHPDTHTHTHCAQGTTKHMTLIELDTKSDPHSL